MLITTRERNVDGLGIFVERYFLESRENLLPCIPICFYAIDAPSTFREGSWAIVHGMEGNPDAVMYQLQLADSQLPLSFLRVDENYLFLMDRAMNLLVGNELFSHTLSRTDPGTR